MDSIIKGDGATGEVTVGGEPLAVDGEGDPVCYRWSRGGASGGCEGEPGPAKPSDLAFAVLYRVTDERTALAHSLAFLAEVVAKLPRDFEIAAADVRGWLERRRDDREPSRGSATY